MGKQLTHSAVNVQTIVSAEVHKALRNAAYDRNVPVRDLMKEILAAWVAENVPSNQKDQA